MKTTPTPEQKCLTDYLEGAKNLSIAEALAFAQACALDRIAQSIEHFCVVLEKAIKEHP